MFLPPASLANLQQVDRLWFDLKNGNAPIPQVVNTSEENLTNLDSDIIISGGTLGILLATALQQRGWSVVILEKGILRGRAQEWNISRQELTPFVELGLLTEAELEKAIVSQYNPGRVAFHGGQEIWVKDILNIGIDPLYLLETLKQKFLANGGKLLENTPFLTATVCPKGVQVKAGTLTLTTRLFIDAMGHFSPLVKQARQGEKPEGVCLVVGSCAQGYPQNQTGDLIVSFTPILNQCQYFWEAFPARDGRTTYLFTYLDAQPDRFSLQFLIEEYFRLLPEYQQVELEQLQFERFLFGFFPAYRHSPVKFPWNRILPVGDSSGAQSPVSFGGFGAMVRHLQRLTWGIEEALKTDLLEQKALNLLQPYQPNISVTWLFQKTMSVNLNSTIPPQQINDLLNGVFAVMAKLGDKVLYPFLQDVVQWQGLSQTLPRVNPQLVLPILSQVGLPILLDWLVHYLNLGLYTGLYPLGKKGEKLQKFLSPRSQYYYQRWLDAWQYGAGGDYHQQVISPWETKSPVVRNWP